MRIKADISLDMFWIRRTVQNRCFIAIGNLRDSTSNVVVEIERDRSIRHGLIPTTARCSSSEGANIVHATHTWFSGRMTTRSLLVKVDLTLSNSQSLAANPPTRTTCLWQIRKQKLKNKKQFYSHRYFLFRGLLLIQNGLNDTIDGGLKECSDIAPIHHAVLKVLTEEERANEPCDFQLPKSNPTIHIIILRAPKLDILRVIRVAKPRFRSFIETLRDVIKVFEKTRVGKKVCYDEIRKKGVNSRKS